MNLSGYHYSVTDEPNVYLATAQIGGEPVHSVFESLWSGPQGCHGPGADSGCMPFPGMAAGSQKLLPTAGENQPAHEGRNGSHGEDFKRSSF